MNNYHIIFLLPFIAAIIGYLTNWIAIKMLFRPRQVINILGIKLQGVFPKRQEKLAQKLGELVSEQLISMEEIKSQIKHVFINKNNEEDILKYLESKIQDFLENNLSSIIPMVSMFLNAEIIDKVKKAIAKQMISQLQPLIEKGIDQLDNGIDIKKIVYNKVIGLAPIEIEKLIIGLMKKELKFIELIGALLGFLIGLIQVGIVHYL